MGYTIFIYSVSASICNEYGRSLAYAVKGSQKFYGNKNNFWSGLAGLTYPYFLNLKQG